MKVIEIAAFSTNRHNVILSSSESMDRWMYGGAYRLGSRSNENVES